VIFRRRGDFVGRYVGHANVQTDIKEATFWGMYIVSGSDEGRVFIWERRTARLVAVLPTSDDVINCVRGHPFDTVLATSGIEHAVMLWTPIPDQDKDEEPAVADAGLNLNEPDVNRVVEANQKRLQEGPTSYLLNHALMQLLVGHYRAQRGRGGGTARGRGGRGGGGGGGSANAADDADDDE